MTKLVKLLSIIGVLLLAFALGRYSAPKSVVTDTKKNTEIKRNTNKHSTTTTVKTPDGGVKIIKVVDSTSDTETKKESSSSSSTTYNRKVLNVSLLAGNDSLDLSNIKYGISVTKEIIGPITAGVYGLNNGTLGVSIGVNF